MTLSVNAIKQLSVEELLELFATLEAPSINEMNGEYAASLLRQTDCTCCDFRLVNGE
jgi:hypothetical protein